MKYCVVTTLASKLSQLQLNLSTRDVVFALCKCQTEGSRKEVLAITNPISGYLHLNDNTINTTHHILLCLL